MRVVSSISERLPDGLYSKVAQYRHHVFVERLGWPLQTQNGIEQDQFDRPDTVYIVAQDDADCIVGCARLLPTTRPYLLGEVFPELLNGMSPPCSDDVWELSRFAAVDFNGRPASKSKQFSSHIAINLLHNSLRYAASYGAKRLITVSPIGVERLLQNIGVNAHRAGPPMVIDGHPIFACWIEVPRHSERTDISTR